MKNELTLISDNLEMKSGPNHEQDQHLSTPKMTENYQIAGQIVSDNDQQVSHNESVQRSKRPAMSKKLDFKRDGLTQTFDIKNQTRV